MMKKRTSKKKDLLSAVKHKTSEAKKKISGKKNKSSKKKKLILNVLIVCAIVFIACMCAFFAYIVVNAPKFNPNNLKFTQMTEVYDRDKNLIVKLGNENRTEITYDKLPEVLIDAIVATEDSRFFEHHGFDLSRFSVATLKKLVGKNGGGASTLTMQIVKNNYTAGANGKIESKGIKGIIRKFTDIYMAIFKVEKKYTKKEIMEFYVNDSYLGNGAYGVEQAAQNYFGKSASDLNLSEAAFIAGLYQAPGSYDPYNSPENAEKRRKTVLYLMQRHGYITEEERKIAESKPITAYIKSERTNSGYSEYQGYIDTMVEELEKEYDLNPYTTPLKIYTAMNRDKQNFVNKVMNGEAWNWENNLVQAGVVMTDSQTGEVLAVGAGRNKNTERSFNFATQTNKQIGSTAKPIFDYGPAVEYLGWGTVNYIDDTPTTYSNGKSISNSDGGYKGRLPMYQALGLSRNITALKKFHEVSKEKGNDKIVKFATSLGLTPEVENGKAHEAHAIGSFTGNKNSSLNSPMTMAGAYQAFSNGGLYIKPHTITKFVYKETEEVVNVNVNKTRVMNDSTAYIISYALNWSVTDGLARAAGNIGGVSVAAKTGTSNFDDKTISANGLSRKAVNDLWVCGFTPTQTITFWYGYNRIYKEHYSTTSTWSIRDRFYRNLAENLFDRTGMAFQAPASVEAVEVVKNSIPLKLASSYTPSDMKVVGYFRKGTAPKETTTAYDTLPTVTNVKSSVNGNTVELKWNGISAEDMLNLNSDDSFGSLGYDIYVKNGSSGNEVYVGTTTSNTYTHTTNYSNPIYIIYTAYANYKANRSKGVEHKISVITDFDVEMSDSEINQGETFIDKKPIIVLYNSVDVTSESKIELTSGNVNTSVPGKYKLQYKITYAGNTKTVTRTVTVIAKETTTSSSSDITLP